MIDEGAELRLQNARKALASSANSLATTAESDSESPVSSPHTQIPADMNVDDARKYARKARDAAVATARAASVRVSSAGAHTSLNTNASNSANSKRIRVESRLRALAAYMRKKMPSRPKHRSSSTQRDSDPESLIESNSFSVGETSTPHIFLSVSMGRAQQYTTRRSAPATPQGVPSHPRLNLKTLTSTRSQRDVTVWNDLFDEEPLRRRNGRTLPSLSPGSMQALPVSRRSHRPLDNLKEGELKQICELCDVPSASLSDVMLLITSSFGTRQLDVLVLEELMKDNVLVLIGMLVFKTLDESVSSFIDMVELPAFLLHVQGRYCRDMPFHNACHAADVLHSLFAMLWHSSLGDKIALHNQIGALFAALMHDIEHVGLSNDFLVRTRHDIAQRYPGRTPMESMHADLAIRALLDTKFNMLRGMNARQQQDVLTVVRETILATALCYQKELLADITQISHNEWSQNEGGVLPQELQVRVLRCAVHASDIGQTTKPFALHQKWVHRLTEENFQQGDLDKLNGHNISPCCFDRDRSSNEEFLSGQVDFLKSRALPALSTLHSIPWLDLEALVDGIQTNAGNWQSQRRFS